MRPGAALGLALLALSGAGCVEIAPFACNGDNDCVRPDAGLTRCIPTAAGVKYCAVQSDCPSGFLWHESAAPRRTGCVEPSCIDTLKDGQETDIDCGGPACDRCAPGAGCSKPSDCESGVCGKNGKCAQPLCTDLVRNGGEADIDCGGAICPACADGKACQAASDCTSGVCQDDKTCAAPTCADRVRNGSETDVDCGGPACPPCAATRGCARPADCASFVCSNMKCAAPSCTDQVRNGGETDVDCGATCDPCANGKGCGVDRDCADGWCKPNEMRCVAPVCADMFKNGGETDVDCGGPACTGCAVGRRCQVDRDCASLFCKALSCQVSCNDGVLDGAEADLDCGGAACPKCADGRKCGSGSDCTNGVCSNGRCATPTCTDKVKNGQETDADCGGPICAACADGKGCMGRSDCASGVCTMMVCRAPNCVDLVKNGKETDVDCGGGSCPACADFKACLVDGDCASGVCRNARCAAPSCMDGVRNGMESDVDCGGNVCPGCADGRMCSKDGDCANRKCYMGQCAPLPTITSVTPGNGPTTGNIAITINGTGFAMGATVTIGGQAAQVNMVAANQITVTLPPRAGFCGAVDVTVTNPSTQSATKPNLFRYYYGNVRFASSTIPMVGDFPISIAADDLDGDGRTDVVAANFSGNTLSLIQNAGMGAFNAPVVLPPAVTQPVSLAIADFDLDGKLDLAVASFTGNLTPGSAGVLLGNGNSTFKAPVTYTAGNGVEAILAGDFKADGRPDLVIANYNNGNAGSATVLLNQAGGGFVPGTTLSTGKGPLALEKADFDGDGKLDLAVANSADNTLGIYLGNGDGTFRNPGVVAVSPTPRALAATDLDNDGKIDLLVVSATGNFVDILLGNKDGTFRAPPPPAPSSIAVDVQPWAVAAGDLNCDGLPDLAVSTRGNNNIADYVISKGAGAFQAVQRLQVGKTSSGLLMRDMSGDGKPDILVTGSGDGTLSILLNTSM